jgi:hypothetical protein
VRDYPIKEFASGIAVGLAALAVALGLAAVGRHLRSAGRVAPIVGLPITVAAFVAISTSRAPTPSVIGLWGLTSAVAVAGVRRPPGREPRLVLPLLVAAPFAYLLAVDTSQIEWVRAVVAAGATVGPVAAVRTDIDWGPTRVTPVLCAISAAGVFAAVPNTEAAAALLGAYLPGALAGWPLGRARLGRVGATSATALLVWVAGVGALGREAAIVGALACLGLLVALPAGRWLATRAQWRHRLITGPLLVLVIHTAVVTAASRVAGTGAELRVAVPAAILATVVAVAASALLQTSAVPSGTRSR